MGTFQLILNTANAVMLLFSLGRVALVDGYLAALIAIQIVALALGTAAFIGLRYNSQAEPAQPPGQTSEPKDSTEKATDG